MWGWEKPPRFLDLRNLALSCDNNSDFTPMEAIWSHFDPKMPFKWISEQGRTEEGARVLPLAQKRI